MPRRKADTATGLGKSIINRKAKEARIDPKSARYTEDNERLNSVTHERDLDEFLNSAALADTDFTAERNNVKVVSSPSIPNQPGSQNPFLLTSAQEREVARRQAEMRDGLRVPRRPRWTRDMARGELERRERESFLEWRRGLADLSENHNLLLTPFERNLQVWRQLWRVLERCQLIVQIVDARNPQVFRCEDLERYVREVRVDEEGGSAETAAGEKAADQEKGRRRSLLLVNKADLLTRRQRAQWAEYFDARGISYAFFSAAKATAEQEAEERLRRREVDEEEDREERRRVARENGEDEESSDEEEEDSAEASGDQEPQATAEADELSEEDLSDEEHEDDLDEDEELANRTRVALANSLDDPAAPKGDAILEEAGEDDAASLFSEEEEEGEEDEKTKVLSVGELEELFDKAAPPLEEFATEHNPNPTKLMVGLVGYPNVGKSSTINALIGSKKVSVSATPGKTKHFQTLPFSDRVTLCDCPGLVFPQFVNTQADMVCDGVLPIDQMREASAPVELLVRRIPREILEGTYGIRIDVREVEDGGTGRVGWEDLLSTYAIARGLTRASFGMPDTSRAARYILKDYVNARLLFCHPPPGIDSDAFMAGSRAQALRRIKQAELDGKKRAPTTRVTKGADTFVNTPNDVMISVAEARERQATSKSVKQSAASAPARTGAQIAQGLDGTFFKEEGPSARPVAKGVVGQGLAGGYSRTTMYPHAQAVGSDGTPLGPGARRIDAVAGRDKSKRHFKVKEGKKRSGRGYD